MGTLGEPVEDEPTARLTEGEARVELWRKV